MKRFSIIAVIAKLGWLVTLLCSTGCVEQLPVELKLSGNPNGFQFENYSIPQEPEQRPINESQPVIAEQPVKPTDETVIEQPIPQILVYYYCKPRCIPCDNFMADSPAMAEFNFVKGVQDAWSISRIGGYPYFRWQVAGQWVGESHGWTGPAAFRGAYKTSLRAAAAGHSTSLPSTSDAATAAPTHYPAHTGMTWNVEGDWHPSRQRIINHLSTHPNHRDKYSSTWLNSLSYQELVSLHDDDHNGRVRPLVVRPKPKKLGYTRIIASSHYCPT